MRTFAAYLLVLQLAWLAPAHASPAALAVSGAWARAIPGSGVAAVYFTVRNAGAQTVSIASVSSPTAADAMIHDSKLTDGRSTMRPHGLLSLAPGQAVTLAPEGMHVMLSNLAHPLVAGDRVALVLHLEDGTQIPVTAVVRALDAQ